MEAVIRIFDLTTSFGNHVTVDDANSEMEKGGILEDVCQRVEDDPERKAKLLEMLDIFSERIKTLGEDRLE